jgi:NAD(P)-dependent dehydrogenase (short-subunit alcohol dehydrogenase family)
MSAELMISTGNLTRQSLAGQVAVVTGAGGGIGLEAVRALVWLGAKAVIAEIDKAKGRQAAEQINTEMGAGSVLFVQTDVGDEHSVENLAKQAKQAFGKVDIVINNATITPLGAVIDLPIKDWDASYRVNLRGAVLLAQAFLPGMLQRKYGVFCCVSSTGDAFMSAYESLKAAQVQLARALDAELEGSGVIVFTIGPGLVMTDTAQRQIKKLAPMYGKSVDEFYAMSQEHILSAETAGTGFAVAVAFAQRFKGLEIDSRMALNAAGISYEIGSGSISTLSLQADKAKEAALLAGELQDILAEQVDGWKARPLFERQWVIRDFKKQVGISAEQCLDELAALKNALKSGELVSLPGRQIPRRLAGYFLHYQELASGFVKDQAALAEQLAILRAWQDKAEALSEILGNNEAAE